MHQVYLGMKKRLGEYLSQLIISKLLRIGPNIFFQRFNNGIAGQLRHLSEHKLSLINEL